ncbi:MAG: hypothetical protein J1E00_06185 [Oscillospiraceae bacterium]|nr:hypothetical protein [Oscillospiraceae bacterium]
MIRRLRFKFVLLNMILTTAILIAAGVCIYVLAAENLKAQSVNTLRAFADRPLTAQDRYPDPSAVPADAGEDAPPDTVFVIYVNEENDTYLVEGLKDAPEDRETYLTTVIRQVYASDSSEGILSDLHLRYLSLSRPYGRKLVLLDMKQENASMRVLLISLLVVGSGAIALFLLASHFSSRIMVRPVEQSMVKQQQLVSDISHELKTPVAVISASADVIRSHREEPVSAQEKWLDYITSETRRMSAMISDILQLARTNEAPELASREVLDLSELAYGAALPFESLCFERNRELDIRVEPDLYVRANSIALRQLISTLLDNASKYSNEGGKVFLCLRGESEKVILSVRNTGTPIPQESLPHIFDRFYRVDEARTRSEGSYGLGLAIAKKLTEDNGGKISVESSEADGNTFTCTFRRSKRADDKNE